VLTRQALLDAVWGEDYIGGSRAVGGRVCGGGGPLVF